MEQCSKTSKEGKEPNCLKVVFSWFVKRMMCQACLLGTGTGLDNSRDSYSEWLLSFCLPASCSACYHRRTATARNRQLPLVSRGVGNMAREKTSDAGQVQKSPAELCHEKQCKACHGLKHPTPGKKWENTPCFIWPHSKTPRKVWKALSVTALVPINSFLSVGLIFSALFMLNSSLRLALDLFTVSEY